MLAGLAVACTSNGQPALSPPPVGTSSGAESVSPPVTPSITPDVPSDQRRELTEVARLCDLLTPDELDQLAFPVKPGYPRDLDGRPRVRGCTYDSPTDIRSVLVASQPTGYAQTGEVPVDLRSTRGTMTLDATGCTVLAPVAGATLQVTVTTAEADSDQCETGQAVAQYLLPSLRH